ncbi:unnamed protein product [Adineta ricciae]|uniref:Fucosyltransferase n=1 Tax=Adineta ricciae TaxID=249248 RepID=A0A815ZH21_ADIRI|nr:unnamed protein product [Adineta ricciae]
MLQPRKRGGLINMYPLRRYLYRICTLCTTFILLIITIHSFFVSYDPDSVSSTSIDDSRPIEAIETTTIPATPTISPSVIGNRSSNLLTRRTFIPDIFDLTLWRHAIIGMHGNQTQCRVPRQYRAIADAFCNALGRGNCPRVPCTLVHISDEFTQYVECLRGGKVAVRVKPDWVCRKSAALEVLSNPERKPSVQAEAYTRLTSDLYVQALGPYHDKETTKWGLTLEGEAIGYYPSVILKTRLLPLFDITIGYDRRIFDVVTDLYLLDYVDLLTNRAKQRLTVKQVLDNKVKGRPPILWMNSNCDTPSNRTGYMLELMRYIEVDVRGKCGNPNWNDSAAVLSDTDPKILAREKLAIAGEYLFTVAIENTLTYDYVTEKLWQPLSAGSVPLYLGATNIEEWLPCANTSCIVDLRQYKSPKDLADHLHQVIQHRHLYMRYHNWRRKASVKPSFLKIINYLQESNQHTVECMLCDMIHRKDRGETRRKLLTASNPFENSFPSLV